MRWAAMLRGINLGKRQLKKPELIAAAEACGFTEARTLLASGNLVFEAGDLSQAEIEQQLHEAVEKLSGIKSEVFARNARQMEKVVAANPFPDVAKDRPSQLLVLFHSEKVPAGPLKQIAEGYDGPERLEAVGRSCSSTIPRAWAVRSSIRRWPSSRSSCRAAPAATGTR